ncbi:RICIN domain-containing protein [Actinoplanes sp. N902-109]|uniref:RICIN domain-containing protein n=1 Tax=Actinoplanes sp. (strain N902-109) TaxID=649831 RepID=UPI00032946C6|nr:RICIN domain-containing protein [Actinoplanes sp. N902-109]AGL19595.1 ricin B lectin [Actinoplanes sp. N902-109]
MSAHRRLELRGEAPKPGRRRATTRPHRIVPLALGVLLLGVGGVVGPGMVTGSFTSSSKSDEQISYDTLPADNRSQGLVYDGLAAGTAGSLCTGTYELDDEICSYGPDPAPAGMAVSRDAAPVAATSPAPANPQREQPDVPPDAEIVRDEGGVALRAGAPALIPDAAPGEGDFILGAHDVACEADGRSGKRVQVLYLHEFGTPSRYSDYVGSIRQWAAGVDEIFDQSAAETGGSRHLRYVTTPQCRVDVAEVQVPAGALGSFKHSIDALQKLGYNRTDRKYLVFADSHVYCGIGTYVADTRPGLTNRNNGGPSYGRIDAGCWSSVVAALETTHMLGAVLHGSPNSTGAGRCTDDYDLLCGPDRSGKPVRQVCPKKHETRLDCGHDDYFSTNPAPDSYLADHWNVALSEFLLRSDGGDDLPDAPDAVPGPEPSPSTSGSALPSGPAIISGGGDEPGPSGGAAPSAPPTTPAAVPGVQAVVEIRDPTSTSVRLTWSAAAPDAKYTIDVDGVSVATTVATRARLVGLRPDTKYAVTIRADRFKYAAKGIAQSAPSARPAANTWFVLTNSLTGDSADLYAARTATGTPVALAGTDGGAQQQWKLVPAGSDTFALQSKATGKCIVPLGGNPVAGAPLVQGDCATNDSGRWRLFATDYGFALRTDVGGLAAGVGGQRFGELRLLVLQQPGPLRHQSWTALPG